MCGGTLRGRAGIGGELDHVDIEAKQRLVSVELESIKRQMQVLRLRLAQKALPNFAQDDRRMGSGRLDRDARDARGDACEDFPGDGGGGFGVVES